MLRRDDISDTLRQRVLSALHFGTLQAGDRLPSARVLASELGADPRVVTAAYRRLEVEGVVERRPPSRAHFVSRTLSVAAAPRPTEEWLVEVLAGGLARGVAAPDFPEHARRSLETLRLRAACIACNRDHLVWLCRELHEDYGVEAASVDLDTLDGDDEADAPPLPPVLRSADLLLTTPVHAVRIRRLAERLAKPLVVAMIRPDLAAEVARRLAEGPLWFVGTDPRFERTLRARYPEAPAGHVRVALVGRDDVAAIPDGSAAWVMRTARDALGGVPPNLRPLSTLRAFSPDTQRELLRFVVRANMAARGALP